MGRKSNTDKIEEMKESTTNKEVKDIFSEISKILSEDDVYNKKDKEWVSTGLNSFNFLLSGDVDLGTPSGNMIVVAGERQSGKSIFGARFLANAQKMKYYGIWFDSEHASSDQSLNRLGIDMKFARRRDISSVEEFQIKTIKLLNWAKENNQKLFIVLDSLGGLSGLKELSDIEEDKVTADMGQRAKNIRTALRNILHKLSETGSILYCVNHVYISPGFIPKKEMGGGLSVGYLGQIVLFLTKLAGEEGVFSKVKIKSMKNREFIEGRTTEFTINFREGFDESSAMIDLFIEFNVIKEKGTWYTIDGDEKSYREKDLIENKEVFDRLMVQLKEKTKGFNYHMFD